MLSFVHLSDIHFHKFSGDRYDVDEDLRNEIKIDIQLEYPKHIENASGIILCGDIAFSGRDEEYKIAKQFIEDILHSLNLSEVDVYCVPGNHDVDQSIPKMEPAVYYMQKMLEEQSDHDKFDAEIANIFHSNMSKKAIYSPIDCYNTKFAAQYSCDLTLEQPYWEAPLRLTDTYELILWGINSTIISNADDHKDNSVERKMKISHLQLPKRKVNAIHMTICHHPPECWFDPNNELSDILSERVPIQLYGHKHLQTIVADQKKIVVGSGAAHPSRKEPDWIPRYNWITINLVEDSPQYLEVKIYPRVWDGSKFICDENNCSVINDMHCNYQLVKLDIKDVALVADNVPAPCEAEVETDWKRPLVYSFINLPFVQRQTILDNLGLLDPEVDEGKKHYEIINDILKRAEEKKYVHQFIEEVKKYKEA